MNKRACGDGRQAEKRRQKMNFHDKKFRRIVSIIILVLVAAMVLTMVLPYVV